MKKQLQFDPRLFRYGRSPLTRRDLLRRAAGLGIGAVTLPSLLAACGADDDSPATVASPGADPTPTAGTGGDHPHATASPDAASGTPASQGDQEATGEITVFGWGGVYDFAIPEFTESTGIAVTGTYWGGEAEGLAKVRVDPTGLDITMFCAATSFEQLRQRDLLQEIDVSRLENWQKIHPALRDNLPFKREDGVIDNVPFDWGATGLLWNEARTGGPLDSWTSMLDEKYRGRTGLQDSAQAVFYLATFIEGGDPMIVPTQESDIDDMIPTMRRLADHARALWSAGDDLVQLVGNGEVWVTDAWDGLSIQLINEGFTDVRFIRAPVEGSIGWSCGMQILRDAPNPDAAYLFLDHFIADRVQVEYTTINGYACVNSECHEVLAEEDPELYETTGLNDADNAIPLLKIPPAWSTEMLDHVNQRWTEIKVG